MINLKLTGKDTVEYLKDDLGNEYARYQDASWFELYDDFFYTPVAEIDREALEAAYKALKASE